MPRLIDGLVRHLPYRGPEAASQASMVSREWLVTNGLGGYSAGTIAGVSTRRYHGLLIAALPDPLGRVMMLNHLSERLLPAGRQALRIGGENYAGGQLQLHGAETLAEFRLEGGLPVWRYEADGLVVEKRIWMPYLQNTTLVSYELLSGSGPVQMELHPAVHFRGHDESVSVPLQDRYTLDRDGGMWVLTASGDLPSLRLHVDAEGVSFTVTGERTPEIIYEIEERRGYQFEGQLWRPGYFTATLENGHPLTLIASTESPDVMTSLTPDEARRAERERRRRLLAAAPASARTGVGAELILAADQFVIAPEGREARKARAQASGDAVRTVIAGYYWFTDWGRDTMISLEGLTLTTGRLAEAGYILRTFADYVRDGLIPNLFPEGQNEGLYHTADATLWLFHALNRYLVYTADRWTLRDMLPRLLDIVEHHLAGTRFGIHVDPNDGLLVEGAPGYQLTWMDAKVDGWVVTPRRGKAVEINALWYNALRLLEGWLREEGRDDEAQAIAAHAAKARASFNARFWYEEGGYLYDVVDGEHGDDPSCRPNQLLAISLDHPILEPDRWPRVMDVVQQRLLTPVGLRSLAPGSPDYQPKYDGDLRARDAAYHQGTVWAWLIGPWVDAWLRVHPRDRAGARRFLEGLAADLDDFGVGTIGEIFDAEPPFTPRGCIAQAWSVAEELRCWVKTAEPPR